MIWRCEKGHEWEAVVKSRTINKTGCPYCSHNKVLAEFNDLATLLPDIAAEWSDRNYPLLPTKVTVFANRKAWWTCKDCGREWNTLISTRSSGSKCPYCSGYIFSKGFNDLQTTHPEIASEWSEKNLPLKPDEVNTKSRKNVWWRCSKCGNEWKSVINARVKGTVCPVCAEREVLAGYNDLETTDSQLLSEWDYEQNKLKPTEITRLPEKNEDNEMIVKYLTESRGLEKNFVMEWIVRGDIYEEKKHHNVIFVGRDADGIPRYAHCRGTGEMKYRGDVAGSDKSSGFCYRGKDNQLFVFEAAIDLLFFYPIISERLEETQLPESGRCIQYGTDGFSF